MLPLGACDSSENAPSDVGARPIAWAEAKSHEPVMRLRLPGVVQAVKRTQLSFEVGGKIESITVSLGDRFSAGDVLATLEPDSYDLEVQRAEAALAEARAVAAEAENDYARRQELVAEEFVSEAALDQARMALETASSRVETAEASLALARENRRDTIMTAPYPGEVTARLLEPSQQVAPGRPVLSVQGTGDSLEVRVLVPETLINGLARGTRHPITFPVMPGFEATGTITEVGTDAVEANTYPVALLLEPADTMPTPGMTAEVAFHARGDSVGSGPLVSIPVTAFLPVENGSEVVFLYDADRGIVLRRKVVIADISEDRALVSEGLQAGDRIASKGLAFLRDQQKVILLGQGPARSERDGVGATR